MCRRLDQFTRLLRYYFKGKPSLSVLLFFSRLKEWISKSRTGRQRRLARLRMVGRRMVMPSPNIGPNRETVVRWVFRYFDSLLNNSSIFAGQFVVEHAVSADLSVLMCIQHGLVGATKTNGCISSLLVFLVTKKGLSHEIFSSLLRGWIAQNMKRWWRILRDHFCWWFRWR